MAKYHYKCTGIASRDYRWDKLMTCDAEVMNSVTNH